MAPTMDHAKSAFNVLMSSGRPRIHPHVYFGLPIKFIAIVATFLDLIINIFPVVFSPQKYMIFFIASALGTRLAAFYTVFHPSLKSLNMYRGLLLATILVSFAINFINVVLALIDPRGGCHKQLVKHTFDITGILTPIEILVFMAISAYAAFIADEEANDNGQPPTAPPADINFKPAAPPADINFKPKSKEEVIEQTNEPKENTVRSLNGLKMPLMGAVDLD